MLDTVRIAAVSDLHGNLPTIPDDHGIDLVVVAGDVVDGFAPYSEQIQQWRAFGHWLADLVKRGFTPIGVGGNHDFILQVNPAFAEDLPWYYLEDSALLYGELRIYGTPWQPWMGGWAYNAPEDDLDESFLREKFQQIPEGTDLVIAHTPPLGVLDGGHIGSAALSERLEQIGPQAVVFGHSHTRGIEQVDDTLCFNVSCTGKKRQFLNHPPVIFDLEVIPDRKAWQI